MNKILKIFFFNFLLFFSFILILELIFGSWLKKQNWGNTLRSERLKKISYSVKFKENTYDFVYRKNSLGFRGEEVEPDKIKIIMMGGSTVNQRFTPQNLTVVGQLNKLLGNDNINLKIYNGGVDGQSTVGLISNFKKWFPNINNFNPKIIVYYIGVNERFYYNYNPNPENFETGEFKTPHAFDRMQKSTSKERFIDYIKNNSFISSKVKKIQLKYFLKKTRKPDYSKFTATYNLGYNKAAYILNYYKEKKFYSQIEANKIFDIDDLLYFKSNYYKSLNARLSHLVKLTYDIDAEPIFINQVLNDGQRSESMYFTNYIVRDFCKKNNIKLIDIASFIKFNQGDFYDEFHTTPDGSKIIAEVIYPLLKNYLNQIL